MASGNRKYLWLVGAGVAAATLIVYWAVFWPPVPRGWIQGAIGQRDVYRESQMGDKDVGVAGKAKVTVDDVRRFLQSPEFQGLAQNAQFNQLLASPQFQRVIAHAESGVIEAQAQGVNQGTWARFYSNPQFQQIVVSAQYRQIASDARFRALFAMPAYQAVFANTYIQQLAARMQLAALVDNTAQQNVILATPVQGQP